MKYKYTWNTVSAGVVLCAISHIALAQHMPPFSYKDLTKPSPTITLDDFRQQRIKEGFLEEVGLASPGSVVFESTSGRHGAVSIVYVDKDGIVIGGGGYVSHSQFAPHSREKAWIENGTVDSIRIKAQAGDADAQNCLGAYVENGNVLEAIDWFKKSAEQGNPQAEYNLGQVYSESYNGFKKDPAEAYFWASLAADSGDNNAYYTKYQVAKFITLAQRVSVNDRIEKWEQGHPHLVAASVIESIAHLTQVREKASAGDIEAQKELADMYVRAYWAANPEYSKFHSTEHVPQDTAEAAKWYRKAAEQGDASAQWEIAEMYGNGRGVKADYLEAYFWIELVARTGISGIVYDDDRGNILKHLTLEQKASVEKRVAEWRPAKNLP